MLHQSGSFSTIEDRTSLVEGVSARSSGDLVVEPIDHERTHLMFIVQECAGADCLETLIAVSEGYLRPHQLLDLQQLRDEWNAAMILSDADWRLLRTELESLRLANLHDLYRRTVPYEFRPPPSYCVDPWRVFAHLVGLNGGTDRVPPCMLFLWLVADLLPGSKAVALQGILARLVQKWDIAGAFQRACSGLTRTTVGRRWDPTLLIAIDFDRPGFFSVISWTQWASDQQFKRGRDRIAPKAGLEMAVQEIVASAEAQWPSGYGKLRIEFLLPLDLLNLPVEQWSKEMDPDDGPIQLYKDYPVVVRSLDRIRDLRRRRVWHQRWNTLHESPESAQWLPSGGPLHSLLEEISRDERIVTMILSEPPPGSSDGAAREIRIAIHTGVPIVIWHRTEAPASPFYELIESLIVGGGMADLPDRASKLRITTSMNEDDRGVGQGLVLLWDDPSRLPGEFGSTTSDR